MASFNNNKEFFELLDGSDSQSGSGVVQQLVIPPRKKRFRRRLRNHPSIRHEGDDKCGCCKPRTVSLTLFCSVVLCWLVTLTWLAVVLYKEIVDLNSQVIQVVAAHQGVPDALHECHSLSRDLQKNQTAIMERLTGFSFVLGNFSNNLSDVRTALAAVQLQLKTSPSLVNDPRLVKDLSERVAEFGSKIQDLEATTTGLKEQDSKIDASLTIVSANLTDLRGQVSSLSKIQDGVSAAQLESQKAELTERINQLATNITSVNNTLSNQFNWTSSDQRADRKAIEGLQEMNQNVTARLTTLEGMYSSTRTSTSTVPTTSVSPSKPTPLADLFPPPSNAENTPWPLLTEDNAHA